ATSGRQNAYVLPEPVRPRPRTPRPDRASGSVAARMGAREVRPAPVRAASREEETPRSANERDKVGGSILLGGSGASCPARSRHTRRIDNVASGARPRGGRQPSRPEARVVRADSVTLRPSSDETVFLCTGCDADGTILTVRLDLSLLR